jgi:uncharacterized membrane protein (DUF2068 family)
MKLTGRSDICALRSVACFEFMKGFLALAVGFWALVIPNGSVPTLAGQVLHMIKAQPHGYLARLFVSSATSIPERKLIDFGIIALVYSAVRFLEGYGLWRERVWAEWLAVVMSVLYLPFELLHHYHHASLISFSIIILNVMVMLYLGLRLSRQSGHRGQIMLLPNLRLTR